MGSAAGNATLWQIQPPERDKSLPARDEHEPSHPLTARQIAAIQYVIHLFVEEDLGRGVRPNAQIYCDACSRHRPRAGAIPYGDYLLCNQCAAEFEVAKARRMTPNLGQFIRDKHYGEAERYRLPSLADTSVRRTIEAPTTEVKEG
jgi:hypothetical protein